MNEGTPILARIVSNGKVTIPKHVRQLLALRDGDYVEILLMRKVGSELDAAQVAPVETTQ